MFVKCPENTLRCECVIQMFVNVVLLYSGKAAVEKPSDTFRWLYCILMRFSVLFWINYSEAVTQYAPDSYVLSNKRYMQFLVSSCKTLKDWIPTIVTVILWKYCKKENKFLLSVNFLLPNGSFKNDGASLRYWTVMVTSSPAFRSKCTCQCDK